MSEDKMKDLIEKFKETGLYGKKFTTARRMDGDNTMTVRLFKKLGMEFTDDRSSLDSSKISLIVASGGQDLCPVLYGQTPHITSSWTIDRDLEENYNLRCVPNNVVKLGICRGAQLISTIHGGTMYQHISGHASGPHDVECLVTGATYKVNSHHHQGILLGAGSEYLAFSTEETDAEYCALDGKPYKVKDRILEAGVFTPAKAYMIQSHPEYETGISSTQTLQMMVDHLYELDLLGARTKAKAA